MRKRINKKQIVIVSTHFLKPRIFKIAYALSGEGYEVILFYNKIVNDKFELMNHPYFREAYGYTYHTEWLCILRMMKFHPLVYHVFSEQTYNKFSHKIIKMRNFLGKIVYDEYDMTVVFVQNAANQAIEDEKYCLENADGVCCRSFALEYAKEKYNYHIKSSIQFFDYCWNDEKIRKGNAEEIKGFVSAGGVNLKCPYKQVAETLNCRNMLYHVYPAGISDEAKAYLYKLQNEFQNFKLMEPINNEELISTLTQYIAGLLLYKSEIEKKQQLSYDYAVANQIFDYVDAGLPIVSDVFGRFLDVFAEYGVLYRTNGEDFERDIDDILRNIPKMKENVARCREDMDIKKHISKLIAFYHSLQ